MSILLTVVNTVFTNLTVFPPYAPVRCEFSPKNGNIGFITLDFCFFL